MTGPQREVSYTRRADAVTLHETFVTNVLARLNELRAEWANTPAQHGTHHSTKPYSWLAAKSGVPVRTVENLMALNNQPTMVGAAKIALALGVSLDSLLGQEAFGRAPSSDPNTVLACIHTAKLPNSMVCGPCLAKWQSYQQRLRALYETNRAAHRVDWNVENTTTRAAQLAAANLPKDTDE